MRSVDGASVGSGLGYNCRQRVVKYVLGTYKSVSTARPHLQNLLLASITASLERWFGSLVWAGLWACRAWKQAEERATARWKSVEECGTRGRRLSYARKLDRDGWRPHLTCFRSWTPDAQVPLHNVFTPPHLHTRRYLFLCFSGARWCGRAICGPRDVI